MSHFGIVPGSARDADLDDTAEGGSQRRVLAVLLAFVVASSAVGLYYLLNRPQPPAQVEIQSLRIVPRHVTSSGVDANGAPKAIQSVDQVLIFAHLRLHNPANHPLVLKDLQLEMSEGNSLLSLSAASRTQFTQAAIIYPDLPELKATVLPTSGDLEAGQSMDGEAFWLLAQSPAQWAQHAPITLAAQFQYQPSVRVPLQSSPAPAH